MFYVAELFGKKVYGDNGDVYEVDLFLEGPPDPFVETFITHDSTDGFIGLQIEKVFLWELSRIQPVY